MQRTSPARNSDRAGFTLLEVVVALAVVALIAAAASSAVLLSGRLGNAAEFDRHSRDLMSRLHAEHFGLVPLDEDHEAGTELTLETEELPIDSVTDTRWVRYRIGEKDGSRQTSFYIGSPAALAD